MTSLKSLLLLAVYISQAAAMPGNEIEARGCNKVRNAQVITYSGPSYILSADDWAARENATLNNTPWDAPAGVPRITLEPGQLLDFGLTDLTKRDGNRFIGAFAGYGCFQGTFIAGVKNFGCGTGCITITTEALSGIVQQQRHGGDYPTMDVWARGGCQGNRLQHFGVESTSSCTNVNNCSGYLSFIGYYSC
ncbi:hypothetical protein NQ176_g6845 [Zarea fungicola]|uniref:Uncharacterized protein n=1 Tax=Zarea fungicola TaxID=93591 RepID=A0ACC1N2Z7_9HYPO|nr:hypothetical protein NQ176_g6845 [Lecanicillium fungicola]